MDVNTYRAQVRTEQRISIFWSAVLYLSLSTYPVAMFYAFLHWGA